MTERRTAVWKYPLVNKGEFTLTMPAGARLLSVQLQDGQPQLWAWVDIDEATTETRRFRLVYTGEEFTAEATIVYVGTFLVAAGAIVYHLFEVIG